MAQLEYGVEERRLCGPLMQLLEPGAQVTNGAQFHVATNSQH
jgi:hypothetical protein